MDQPVDRDQPGLSDARVHALLAASVESSEDGIVSKTLDGIVTSWNAGAERLFGFSAQEMLGQSITRVIPEELQHEEAMILERLSRGERIERYETERRHKSGARLYVSLTISPIRDHTGQVIGASKIAHDITARRRAERALERELETRRLVEEALRDREAKLRESAAEREQLLQSERAARSCRVS